MTALIVFLMFLLFIAADYIIRRATGEVKGAVAPAPARGLDLQDFRLPKGVFFHPRHLWATLQPGGRVRIGIDDFVQKLTGSVDEIQAPAVGQQVSQGDSLLSLQLGQHLLHVPAPLSGTVYSGNHRELTDFPRNPLATLDRDWLVEIEPEHLSNELPDMTVAEKATTWFQKEMEHLKEFLGAQAMRPALAGSTLPDGGAPIVGVLRLLDADGIAEFEREFLG